jgi:hypothetical protein
MLRTLPTPSTVMADAVKLWWAWRKKADRALSRSILLALLALMFTVATVAASVFSSLIVEGGTIDVLVNSPYCGRVNTNADVGRVNTIGVDQTAPEYSAACYRNGSLPSTCDVFMQHNIPLKVQDAPCPLLNDTWCDTTESVNVDTSMLDVGKTFGINLGDKDRVQYRKATTCSILPIKDHFMIFEAKDAPFLMNERAAIPDEQLMVPLYGSTFSKAPWATFVLSLTLSNLTTKPAVGE